MKNKTFGWILAILGGLLILTLILLVINAATAKCLPQDIYDNTTKVCYYTGRACDIGHTQGLVNGAPVCTYKAKGFMSDKAFGWTIGILVAFWLIFFIIFLVTRKTPDVGAFRKEDFVMPKRALKLWEQTVVEARGLPIINGKWSEKTFDYSTQYRTFPKGKEWFIAFQCHVTDGQHSGIYTVKFSLSRGEQWILGGMQNWQECLFDEYRNFRDMPLWTADDYKERLLEQLAETNPQKAIELQQQTMEQSIRNKEPEAPEPQEQPQGLPQGQPYQQYRRPARRPYFGARRF